MLSSNNIREIDINMDEDEMLKIILRVKILIQRIVIPKIPSPNEKNPKNLNPNHQTSYITP